MVQDAEGAHVLIFLLSCFQIFTVTFTLSSRDEPCSVYLYRAAKAVVSPGYLADLTRDIVKYLKYQYLSFRFVLGIDWV